MSSAIETPSPEITKPESKKGRGYQGWKVFTIGFAHGANDIYMAFVAPLLPVLIQNYSLTKTAAGFLSILTQLPSLIQPFIGHWADRVNLKWAVILAPAISGILISLIGLAPGYGFIAMCFLLAGFSNAAFHAVGPVMAGRFSGDKLGRGMSILMVGGEFGRVFGPIVVVAAIGSLTFRGLPWLMILGIMASVVLFFRLRNETTLAAGNVKPLAVGIALKQIRPLLLPLILISFARSYMEATLTTFMPTFLTEEGASLWLAGSAISILEFAGVFGALLLGPVSDRIGRRIIVFISMLVAPVLMGVFLLLHGWAQLPLLMALGFTTISIAPVVMAIIQERCPDSRALANGIFMALSFVIYSLNVIIIGRIGDLANLRLAFVISIALVLLFSPAALLLPKDNRK